MAAAERKEIVDVPLRKMFDAICDYDSYSNFATGVKKVNVIEKEGDQARVHFDVEMMKRVEYTLDLKHEIDEDERSAKVSWSLVDSKFFKINNGLWELKSLGENKTEVLYKLEIDFSFPAPGFVLKKLVAGALPQTIKEFTKHAQSL
jgi:ribosome-associated toxin RatA of RatAB toxin-antitoxin module